VFMVYLLNLENSEMKLAVENSQDMQDDMIWMFNSTLRNDRVHIIREARNSCLW
jgi:hypothetical protein